MSDLSDCGDGDDEVGLSSGGGSSTSNTSIFGTMGVVSATVVRRVFAFFFVGC
jgi:hypothetical protein